MIGRAIFLGISALQPNAGGWNLGNGYHRSNADSYCGPVIAAFSDNADVRVGPINGVGYNLDYLPSGVRSDVSPAVQIRLRLDRCKYVSILRSGGWGRN